MYCAEIDVGGGPETNQVVDQDSINSSTSVQWGIRAYMY